ncbi:hypothetical protein GOP47_0018490 [Adiantum capillus-veneris]|uniref:Uncharacterized protein n=1 Tax=Adiantum capillus-veneris TaxID=13818 RepID=A0A9D4UER9_ADICA|nr:hypothetical protein GOP47_0018490 [Adiantum capillus-veneris]
MRPDDWVGAVLKKDQELTTLLVRAGCDCNGQDAHGREPLLVAIHKGNIEAINILIGDGCVLTLEALLLSIDRGNLEAISILIGGRCVLTPEAFWGREDAVDALIRAKCDPNDRLALVEAIPKVQIINTIINATKHLDIHKQDARGSTKEQQPSTIDIKDVILKKTKGKMLKLLLESWERLYINFAG